ncbi:hypothetical protein JCM19235_5396 [Vibrio maritimus]|uniref:Uncharacterized protein n=1 Tax=Vibrio maritimus TaxID=990268 RepID=A0A090SBB6_9VIBR|nr:hypothetical protein JCM19235_5396 [Vibrio maritimus]
MVEKTTRHPESKKLTPNEYGWNSIDRLGECVVNIHSLP